MQQHEYVVIRSTSPVTRSPGALAEREPALATAAPEVIDIEEVGLTSREHADLRRDPRTRAIARPMPMKLITPTEVADAAPAAGGATWGVEAVGAMDTPFDGAGITVAVLDTGIDPGHPAFAGVEIVQKNFTAEDHNDGHGHGTHVAGTIFGQDVDGLRIGVAPGVQRALIGKVLGAGGGSSASIAHAIQWAVNEGAHVVSMSLGIDFPGFVKLLVEQEGLAVEPATSIALEQYRANINLFTALADAVRAQSAFGQGTLIVAASGNESRRPDFEIAASPPAAGAGVLAVGALQEGADGLSVASFSNNEVDVAAPGVDVISARLGGGLVSMNGTSMATPHVAGVASLWAQKLRDTIGHVESGTLLARVVASGTTESLAAGTEEEDIGTGIVRVPLH